MADLVSYLILAVVLINVFLTLRTKKNEETTNLESIKKEAIQEISAAMTTLVSTSKSEIITAIGSARTELTATQQTIMSSGVETLTKTQTQAITMQDTRLKELTGSIAQSQTQATKALEDKLSSSEQKQAERIQSLEKIISELTAAQAIAQKQQFELQDTRLKEISESTVQAQIQISQKLEEKLTAFEQKQSQQIQSLEKSISELTTAQTAAQTKQFEMQDKRLKEISELLTKAQGELQVSVAEQLKTVSEQFAAFNIQSKESMESIRKTVEGRLEILRTDNTMQLEKMRLTVDEKLQKTLDTRISQSFQMVNDRLQEVYKGLGEMKTLATGVGDLKKVLTNVKTRGIIGEYQLGAIIEEMLSKEQYDENVATKKGATTRVEYAIKLPGDGNGHIYLPVDAKFPGDTYIQLVDAYDRGNADEIATAKAALATRIKLEAKDIHDKYIDPPNTTDFAIMFLPFEGLYAEVVRDGLVDELQRKYKVNIAGPTTFAALLNSLQMGFKTLAIQKRSSEVWNVLSAVKSEFTTFETALTAAQKRIEQTGVELDKLVGVRTRKINAKLRTVATLPEGDSASVLDEVVDVQDYLG